MNNCCVLTLSRIQKKIPLSNKRNTCTFGTFITDCNLLGDEKKIVLIYQSAQIKSTYDMFAGLVQLTKSALGEALVHSTY